MTLSQDATENFFIISENIDGKKWSIANDQISKIAAYF